MVANLAVEVAPVRVNLISAGFVDTPLFGSLFGRDLEARRDQLRAALPIGRVVGPADVAGVDDTPESSEGLPDVYQLPRRTPEPAQATAQIGKFLRTRVR